MIERRNVRLVTGAVGLSALGDFFALVPLALYLERETGSALVVAGLFFALWSPSIALAGPAGLLADRLDPRRVLIVASLAQAAIAVALAFAGSPAAVLALAVALGAGSALSAPAEFAVLPRVAGSAIATANARVETARYAGMAAGPLLAGLLAAGAGTQLALLVDAATFVVIALAGAALRETAAPAAAGSATPHGRERAREGAAFLLRDPALRAVLPVAVFALVFMTAVWTAEVFFAKDVLEVGDAGYGAMSSVWMLGMIGGATALAARVGPRIAVPVALVAIGVQGLGLALPAVWPVFAFTLAAFLLGGIGHGVKNVVLRTLIHERTPQRLHGRAFAAYNALRNAAELVALTSGGLLVTAIGPRWTLLIAGGIPCVLAAWALVRRANAGLEPAPQPASA
jgi:MFS family permease